MTTNLPANPYVGPRAFTEREANRFFGRQREARDLLARVVSERLLLFYAQSGAGKSSLLHTRLIPGLRDREGFQVLPVGRVSGALPAGAEAVDNIYVFNLLASLDQSGGESAALAARLAHVSLPDFLARLAGERTTDAAGNAARRWVYRPDATVTPPAVASGGLRFALIIDQFEEIISTHPERWAERADFFRQLDAALRAEPNLWIVLTLREDYVASLDPYAALVTNKLQARYRMERMDVAAALEAVRRPAELGGRPFAPGVAESLVDDLRQIRMTGQAGVVPGQYVEPVQLQVVCYQLWENLGGAHPRGRPDGQVQDLPLRGDGEIAFADLAAAGDVDQALEQFYAATLAAVTADPAVAAAGVSERSLRTWFDKELITASGIRSIVLRNESNGRTGSLPNAAVDALSQRFLLRTELRGGGAWVELVHDRFVEPIRASNEAWFAEHLSTLQRAAALWQDSGRAAGLLLADTALDGAVAWASTHQLLPHEQEFLDASMQLRAAAEREKKQSQRILGLAIVAVVVGILAIGTAIFAGFQISKTEKATQQAEAEARRARAGELAIASIQITREGLDPSLSLMLAKEAVTLSLVDDKEPPLQVIDALQQAVGAAPVLLQLAPQDRHQGEIYDVAYSPDGVRFATAGADETVRIWDIKSAQQLLLLDQHADNVLSVAFSSDGAHLVTASWDGTVKVWNSKTGEVLANLSLSTPLWDAKFSPDGERIAVAGENALAWLWNWKFQNQPLTLSGHSQRVMTTEYSPDGHSMITAGGDGAILIWNADTGQPLRSLESLGEPIVSLSFNQDGSKILALTAEGTPWIWDLASNMPAILDVRDAGPIVHAEYNHAGTQIITVKSSGKTCLHTPANYEVVHCFEGALESVHQAIFSPDDANVITIGGHGSVRLWDTKTGKENHFWPGHTGSVGLLKFSSDGRRLVSSSADGTVIIWSVDDLSLVRRLIGHQGSVTAFEFSPAIPNHLLTAGVDGFLHLWDISDGSLVWTAKPFDTGILSASFSPSGDRISITGTGVAAQILDSISGESLVELADADGQTNTPTSAAFHASGNMLLTAGAGPSASIWDAETGSLIVRLDAAHPALVSRAIYSPDGATIATSDDDGRVCIGDMQDITRKCLDLHNNDITALAFSPDGAFLVSGSNDGSLFAWNIALNDAPMRLQHGESGVNSISFSNGEKMVVGSADGLATVFDVRTGVIALTAAGHLGSIYATAITTDGTKIATGGDDLAVRIWRSEAGSSSRQWQAHNEYVLSVALADSTDMLVSVGDDDGTVKMWHGKTGELVGELDTGDTIINSAAIGMNGQMIVTAGDDGHALIWQKGTSYQVVRTLEHAAPVVAVTLDTEAQQIATGTLDGEIALWNTETGSLMSQWEGHDDQVMSIALNPNGRYVASGGYDHAVKLWDIPNNQAYDFAGGLAGPVYAVAFSPDGTLLAAGGEDAFGSCVRIWRVEQDAPPVSLDCGERTAVALAFDELEGHLVVAYSDGTISVWDAESRQVVRNLTLSQGSTGFSTLAVKSGVIYAGDQTGMIHTWPGTKDLIEMADELNQRNPQHFYADERLRFSLNDSSR